MRRLVMLVSVLVFVDTMLYAALTPLLGHFAHTLHLSSGKAGLLVAAYGAGALLGGLPGGVAAARMGPRRAVLTGLTLMGLASLGFALANSFWPLSLARFVQGAGSAFTWAGAFSWLIAAAPRERRGTLIGTAMGAAVVGALFGPVLGIAAALAGRAEVFSSVALVAALLAALTLTIPTRAPERPSFAALRRAAGSRHFRGGLGLLALAALLSGVIDVIAPLHLDAAGWSPAAIGAVWLTGGAVEAVQSPLIGRLSDRRGVRLPVLVALAGGAAVSLLLVVSLAPLAYALVVASASVVYGAMFTPAFALIAEGADRAGLAQGLAFGMMNAAWAVGAMVGPAGAGALAAAAGARIPYVIASGGCLIALVLAGRRRPRARIARATA